MTEHRTRRFVRALMGGASACQGASGEFTARMGRRKVSLEEKKVAQLVSQGVLEMRGTDCRATDVAHNWLKRALSHTDRFASQHRDIVSDGQNRQINLNEGPVARLSKAGAGQSPFLQPHHLQAARRFHKLFERAQMLQRTTLSYDPARTGSQKTRTPLRDEPACTAFEARRDLKRCLDALPADCAGVVMDVCGFEKGLQLVERERQWPRRSAKIILRAGLDQLAGHFGLLALARGYRSMAGKSWMDEDARARYQSER